MTIESNYLDVNDAATYLGVKVRFIRRLVSERRIAFHKAGTHVRFAREDLDAFMKAGRVEPITRATVRRHLRGVA